MIQEMIENGFSIKKVSLICSAEVSYIKSLNFKIKKEQFSIDEIPKIQKLYEAGVSATNLAFKYSIDKRRIQKYVKSLRNKNDSHRFTYFNEHYFDIIDSETKAYWLGFFYADAYNSTTTNSFIIALANKDVGHLIKLAELVELPVEKINTYYATACGRKYLTSSLKLYSKHLCGVLDSYGCVRCKSFVIKYPQFLDMNLNKHFIRGLFDGDGSLTKRKSEWKFSLVSTIECCEEICKIIKNELGIIKIPKCISKTNNNTFIIEISGNKQVSKIMNWLYDDSIIYLDRKHEKYKELKNELH